MQCPECGKEFAGEEKFCTACGEPRAQGAPEPPPAAAAPPEVTAGAVPSAPAPPPAAPPPAPAASGKSRKGLKIALIAAAAVVVIAGVTLGLVFGLGGGTPTLNAETARKMYASATARVNEWNNQWNQLFVSFAKDAISESDFELRFKEVYADHAAINVEKPWLSPNSAEGQLWFLTEGAKHPEKYPNATITFQGKTYKPGGKAIPPEITSAGWDYLHAVYNMDDLYNFFKGLWAYTDQKSDSGLQKEFTIYTDHPELIIIEYDYAKGYGLDNSEPQQKYTAGQISSTNVTNTQALIKLGDSLAR